MLGVGATSADKARLLVHHQAHVLLWPWPAVLHHTGRSITYLLLGLAAGAAGAGVSAAGFGRWVSWLAAAAVVILALVPSTVSAGLRRFHAPQMFVSLTLRSRAWARMHPRAGARLLGILNGLLPCGLTYAATIAAIGTGSVWTAVLFMNAARRAPGCGRGWRDRMASPRRKPSSSRASWTLTLPWPIAANAIRFTQ